MGAKGSSVKSVAQNNANTVKWHIEFTRNGINAYTIKNLGTKKVLAVNGSADEGDSVSLGGSENATYYVGSGLANGANSTVSFTSVGAGLSAENSYYTFSLNSANSGYMLSVGGANNAAYTVVGLDGGAGATIADGDLGDSKSTGSFFIGNDRFSMIQMFPCIERSALWRH